ncbi:MAG: sigma 54-interacting transcriptional regulator [Spirochaetales bacterium]|nr:sigma 54-interacting transcriptional regulator [Spirochaetales bacterium]
MENGEYRRLGDTKLRSSDFRLVTASNEKLLRLVAEGQMRKDFFYRITDAQIHMPPLREHKEDIPLLIRHFYSTLSERRPVTDTSIKLLQSYHWPGNVRQLFSVLRRASLHAKNNRWIEIDEQEFAEEEQ